MPWVYAAASRAGAVHGEGHGGDDAFAAAVLGDVLVAAVADGAGGAKHGGLGARTAVQALVTAAPVVPEGRLLEAVKSSLCQAADLHGYPLHELATTLVAVVAGPKRSFFLQVGDGASVGRPAGDEEFKAIVWPQFSEFVNTTTFVTDDDAGQQAREIKIASPVHDICLTTDGLQYLVLDFKAKQPHQPFFQSVCRKVGAGAEKGEDRAASTWIGTMLSSAPVTSKTDDDTTLLVARWRG